MGRRQGACAKPRASRGVLRHAPRGESTGAGSGFATWSYSYHNEVGIPGCLSSSKTYTDAI
uniref:Candidate secreted effector n=1 Tax=Meloidogyne incognita TaxID=6306 RepID=A0A914M5X8_MELIC